MNRNHELKILGQDDWLLFARTATGELVYIAFEIDRHWLDAPHEGQAKHGSPEWREDNQYMHDWVSGRSRDYEWQACDTGTWPPERDETFVKQSAARYLPRKTVHYLPRNKERPARQWPWSRPDSPPRRRVRRVRHVLTELTMVVGQVLYQVSRLDRLGKMVPAWAGWR